MTQIYSSVYIRTFLVHWLSYLTGLSSISEIFSDRTFKPPTHETSSEMYSQFVHQHASRMPSCLLIRWQAESHKGRLSATYYYSLVHQNGKSPTGLTYTGTNQHVAGNREEVNSSLLSLWDRNYTPYQNKDIGDGIHFVLSTFPWTQKMLLESNASNLQHLCNRSLFRMEDGKIIPVRSSIHMR